MAVQQVLLNHFKLRGVWNDFLFQSVHAPLAGRIFSSYQDVLPFDLSRPIDLTPIHFADVPRERSYLPCDQVMQLYGSISHSLNSHLHFSLLDIINFHVLMLFQLKPIPYSGNI